MSSLVLVFCHWSCVRVFILVFCHWSSSFVFYDVFREFIPFLFCCSLRLAFPDSGLKAHFALPTLEKQEDRKDKADVQNMQNSANALYLWSSMAAIETFSPVYP